MNKDIVKTIIKGKKVTGDDIGRLLLADMAEEYKNFLTTGEVKSIISQDEFNKLLNSLENNYHIEKYNRYVNIHNTIKTYMSMTRGTAGEALSTIEAMQRVLGSIKASICTEITKDKMPLILTQKQYDELMNKYIEPIKNDRYSYMELFLHFIDIELGNYIYKRENKPEETKIDKEAEALIELYKDKPVKNPELRRLYNSMYEGEDGYFTFDSWDRVGDNREEFIHNLALRNIPVIEEALAKYSTKELKKPVDERFIHDILTPEQIDLNIQYELYDKAPETVYKTDLLGSEIFTDATINAYSEEKEDQKEALEVLTLYLKELPELEAFIKGRMSKYKCLKAVGDTKPKDFYKVKLKGADLLEDNVPNYRSYADSNLKDDYPRANKGIAIIKEDILDEYDKERIIDEDGNYKKSNEDDSILNIMEDRYLSAIMELGKDEKNIYKGLYSSLRQVYAHNTFIELVAEVTRLPVVKEAFTFDMDKLEASVEEYNKLLYLLLIIVIPEYGRQGCYEKSREIVENVYNALPYIDLRKAKVTPEAREKALEYISDFNNFKGATATSKPFYILSGWSD